ncbi:branched-chain amino acid ABC transporter permease [Caballeronia sp. TF1N1]|uniref:branched-chain amino acid ABC transporter permease n=1 Tax=Caballeronia sp. TF1N1 TaxID=2878153 RepID=UPI001FD05C65|nr:branched-chain amino acid ABC transporter permease [Caballeronia sp. TF1N1]
MDKMAVFLLAGLTNGSVYGLIGLSLSLIYGTNRIINFAQGDFVMAGAMSAILFMVTCSLPAPFAIAAVIAVVLVAALALEFGIYRPLMKRGAPPLTIMIGTLAGAIIASGGALLIWGANQLYVPAIFSLAPITLGPLTTNLQQLAIMVAFVVLLTVTWFLLYRTSFGLCIRATGAQPRVAQLMGIRASRVVRFGFMFSAAVSGLAGVLVGPLLGGQVSMGVELTVKGFMAAILGGLGSPFASAAGGLAIGVLEAFVAGYGSSLYAEPIIFLLILLVLLVRPFGLLGDFEASRR